MNHDFITKKHNLNKIENMMYRIFESLSSQVKIDNNYQKHYIFHKKISNYINKYPNLNNLLSALYESIYCQEINIKNNNPNYSIPTMNYNVSTDIFI